MKKINFVSVSILAIGFVLISLFLINYQANNKVLGLAFADLNQETSAYININPGGSSVYIDDALEGTSPITIDHLKTGTHKLTLKKEGYQENSFYFAALPEKILKLFVKLPLNNEQLKQGLVLIDTDLPDSKIYLDGFLIGTSPSLVSTTLGEHKVMASKKGYYSASQKIEVLESVTSYIKIEIETSEKSKQEFGSYFITTNPKSLDIALNDMIIGKSPILIFANADSYSVYAINSDMSITERAINIEPNKRAELNLDLTSMNSEPIIPPAPEDVEKNKLCADQDSNCEDISGNAGKASKTNAILITAIIIIILIVVAFIPKKKRSYKA